MIQNLSYLRSKVIFCHDNISQWEILKEKFLELIPLNIIINVKEVILDCFKKTVIKLKENNKVIFLALQQCNRT